ncbi:MAG TPA: metalloregulator ArsR/SmtB family transcription factor [Phycisphaerae bacterium]|nr:metalloregulator ArsR/SmtB family transcription factor [Phycisphaerae bacterium]
MVKYRRSLDATFAALADPTRRAIVARLARGDASVTELARPFKMSLPAVSKHLRVLERAKLLRQAREGRMRRCRLDAQPLKTAAGWIERYHAYWTNQLDSLAAFLEQPDAVPESKKHSKRRKRK